MSGIEVASVYIAVNILILIWLSIRVMLRRFKGRISIGDGGSEDLARAIRIHANASEYIPPMMIGLLALSALGAPTGVLHILGGGFTFGRVIHPQGMSEKGPLILRQIGMLLTWIAMILMVAAILYYVFT